ncbi:MAG TPA: Stp1/IreP family PP2C-type Ser/Thr phosphatase [Actinomycetota bacterium]|nr:Stp1/IreP family PP2C-type Ser/Thr phosphatase [Actinomycetota bacterium]
MNVAVGVQTDVGRVRKGNEDSYLLEAPIYAVADGMGGHIAGDVASATAVAEISDGIDRSPPEDGADLAELVTRANGAIWEKARSDPSLRGMGTTCTLVMIDGDVAHIAHVGDSRAYLLRDGSFRQLTEDHTLVERMVREGRLSAEEAANHPQRNVITRALGVDANVQVDVSEERLSDGDRILITSDGLTSMVEPEEIAEVLDRERDPQAAADRLVEMANDAGGEDNVTVLVLHVGNDVPQDASQRQDGSPAPPPAAPARRDTRSGAHGEVDDPAQATRRWVRPLVRTLAVVAVLAVVGFFSVRWVLSNSWFVAVGDGGAVTIYQGIPEEIAGASFASVEQETDVTEDDLPDSLRDDLGEGRKFDSLEDAEAYVASIEARIEEIEESTEQEQERQRDRRRDRGGSS